MNDQPSLTRTVRFMVVAKIRIVVDVPATEPNETIEALARADLLKVLEREFRVPVGKPQPTVTVVVEVDDVEPAP